MDIDKQIEVSRTWEPSDPGPRPYDPDSADLMRTAGMLEAVFRYIRQSPEASAEMHAASSDPEMYLLLTETAALRERLRLHMAEDPGLMLWLQSIPVGREVLNRMEMQYAMEEPDRAVAEEAIRTAPTAAIARSRQAWFQERVAEHERHTAYTTPPRSAARVEETRLAMLETLRQGRIEHREAGA